MDPMLRKNLIVLFSFIFLFSLLAAACQDTVDPSQETPPPLPPAESMEMDFSAMDGDTAQKTAPGYESDSESYSNFTNAVIRVAVMKTIVNANLAIPRALLQAAQNVDPDFNDNGEWVWTYSHTAGGQQFDIELIAVRQSDQEVQWQLFVSSPDHATDSQLFFEGVTSEDGRAGSWTYFALFGESAGEPVSEITWAIEDEENKQLRLEVLSDRNGNLGDYIEYDLEYPVHRATYYNASEDETSEIQWNSETREGFLTAPGYNDGVQSCWDSSFRNSPCNG